MALKSVGNLIWQGLFPRGKSGLKSRRYADDHRLKQSLPAREEWIEIFPGSAFPYVPLDRLFPRGKSGLKFLYGLKRGLPLGSLPAREEWIEIPDNIISYHFFFSLCPRGKSGLK